MVEVAISVMVIGLMAAAAMRSVATARIVDYTAQYRAKARLLAEGLVWEIMTKAYMDPSTTSTLVLGPESGETTRAQFNDVDDYNGLSESPPKNKDGSTIADLSGWTRTVVVDWVDSSNPTGPAGATETGCKRITVTVQHGRATLATVVAIRTNAP